MRTFGQLKKGTYIYSVGFSGTIRTSVRSVTEHNGDSGFVDIIKEDFCLFSRKRLFKKDSFEVIEAPDDVWCTGHYHGYTSDIKNVEPLRKKLIELQLKYIEKKYIADKHDLEACLDVCNMRINESNK